MSIDHADSSFQPIILSYFKQHPLEEQDRQSIALALKLSYVAAQEHLCNLLIAKKLAKTLNYKYVLAEMKDEVENLSFIPVKKNYEPKVHQEDDDFLVYSIISVFKELNGQVSVEKLAAHVGVSKWDIEIALMKLISEDKVIPIVAPGHKQYILKENIQ